MIIFLSLYFTGNDMICIKPQKGDDIWAGGNQAMNFVFLLSVSIPYLL